MTCFTICTQRPWCRSARAHDLRGLTRSRTGASASIWALKSPQFPVSPFPSFQSLPRGTYRECVFFDCVNDPHQHPRQAPQSRFQTRCTTTSRFQIRNSGELSFHTVPQDSRPESQIPNFQRAKQQNRKPPSWEFGISSSPAIRFQSVTFHRTNENLESERVIIVFRFQSAHSTFHSPWEQVIIPQIPTFQTIRFRVESRNDHDCGMMCPTATEITIWVYAGPLAGTIPY